MKHNTDQWMELNALLICQWVKNTNLMMDVVHLWIYGILLVKQFDFHWMDMNKIVNGAIHFRDK